MRLNSIGTSFLRSGWLGWTALAGAELYRKLGPRQRKIEWLSVALGGYYQYRKDRFDDEAVCRVLKLASRLNVRLIC